MNTDELIVSTVRMDGRITALEKVAVETSETIKELNNSTKSIALSLARIATIEERHEATSKAVSRAFGEISELEKMAAAKIEKMECALTERIDKAEEEFVAICHRIKLEFDGMCDAKEARLRVVENQMESLQMIKNWVISAVIGIIAIFSMLVVHYVFKL